MYAATQARKVIEYLTHFFNGALTEQELVSHLAELDRETIMLMPEDLPLSQKRMGLRERVLELREAIDRGETIVVGSNC